MQFKVQFHRYGDGKSRLSAPEFINAENFAGAFVAANLMRSAMTSVDRANDYAIASIEAQGYRGDECSSGWETQEEFSERVLKGMSLDEIRAECERHERNPNKSDAERARYDRLVDEIAERAARK